LGEAEMKGKPSDESYGSWALAEKVIEAAKAGNPKAKRALTKSFLIRDCSGLFNL
jgi:hypothetical protein